MPWRLIQTLQSALLPHSGGVTRIERRKRSCGYIPATKINIYSDARLKNESYSEKRKENRVQSEYRLRQIDFKCFLLQMTHN